VLNNAKALCDFRMVFSFLGGVLAILQTSTEWNRRTWAAAILSGLCASGLYSVVPKSKETQENEQQQSEQPGGEAT
jgi:hypothetical protein